jgi:hypothetical protein
MGGIIGALVAAPLVFFLAAGATVLRVLKKKTPGRRLSDLRDDFTQQGILVFGGTLLQRLVIRGIVWGMAAVIALAAFWGRVKRLASFFGKWGMHR